MTGKQAALLAKIKEWALANYEKNYGASVIIECMEDAEILEDFSSLKDAKRFAQLHHEQYLNTRF